MPRSSRSAASRSVVPVRAAATLEAVAKHAHVSMMTVSNVVNGRFAMMSAQTRARVENAIAKLGYRRRSDGLSLRVSQRFAIAMVIVDPSPAFLADPFITNVVAGLSNGLAAQGYNLVLTRTESERLEDSNIVRNSDTDGICMMLSGPRASRLRCLKRVAELGEPVIVFQERLAKCLDDVCVIRQDDRGGARALADRTLRKGARRLLMLVPRLHWPAIEERQRGIRDAIRAANVDVAFDTLACGNEHYPETQAALDRHVAERGLPDAILAGNDQMGIAALKWLHSRGTRVPRDLMITGFNAFEFWQYTTPLVTTARSPAYEMGEAGAEAILQRVKTGRFAARERVFPVHVVDGETA